MTTGQREAKHRKSVAHHVRYDGTGDPYSFTYRSALAERCAFEAVQNGFQWLSLEQIKSPPRQYKDAQFARQVAIRLMAVDLGMDQRHIARMQGRQRTSIHFAIRTVNHRLEEPVFQAAYDAMAEAANALYAERLSDEDRSVA